MVAIDMNSGEHRWRIPVGRNEAFPAVRNLGIRERVGLPARSWALVTKTVLIVVQLWFAAIAARQRTADRGPRQLGPAFVGV
jgi:quinoprotein glucose dehydrogenase